MTVSYDNSKIIFEGLKAAGIKSLSARSGRDKSHLERIWGGYRSKSWIERLGNGRCLTDY
jgi:hypothetical protein